MVDLEELAGNLAVITTIGLFLSGLPICYEIYKKKNVGEISHVPFFCASVNTFLNFMYGYLIENDKVIIVNLVGLILEAFYLGFFYYYSQNKMNIFKQVLVGVAGCVIVYVFAFIIEEESLLATTIMGYLGCVAAVVMFASPLSNLRIVLNNKSTESLSFPLCFSTLACSSLWAIYAYIIEDYFIFTPNMLGAILGSIQVSLFYKFRK